MFQVLPLAFIARKDEDSTVAGLWGEVWEEGTTSISAALRMYAADIVPLLNAGELMLCRPLSLVTQVCLQSLVSSSTCHMPLCQKYCHQVESAECC